MRFGELDFRLRVRSLLSGEIEIFQIARLVHSQRGFGGAFRRRSHRVTKIDKLLIALMLVKRRAHFRGGDENFMGNAQLGCFKLRGGDAFAQRQQQNVDELF